MRKLKCDPNAQISGQTVQAYLNNLQSHETRSMFEEYGISEVETDKWYALQPLLDVLTKLMDMRNNSNIIAIGLKIATAGVDAEETTNVPLSVVLEHWNEHMYANVRGADIGKIIAEKVDDNYYRIIHRTVWPDDLLYGLAYGFARHRLPKGTQFKVWYDDLENRLDTGKADKTVICIQWE